MSCVIFLKRNLSFFILAIKTQLEYRLNFVADALAQPLITSWIEMLLWKAVFFGIAGSTLGGFEKEAYLAYALWAAFISRISSNWMYEFRMIEEIESGSINALLTRPFSFYEYYFSQFMGYKFITTSASLLIPLGLGFALDLPIEYSRLPLALGLVTCYLFFIFTLSFIVAITAFHLTRVSSLTVAKNLALWLFSGELVPLDLFPEAIAKVLIYLPFSNAVYTPVGYLTGRFGTEVILRGYLSTLIGSLILGVIAWIYWKKSVRTYAGTAA